MAKVSAFIEEEMPEESKPVSRKVEAFIESNEEPEQEVEAKKEQKNHFGKLLSSGLKMPLVGLEGFARTAAQQGAEESEIKRSPYREAGKSIESFWNKLLGTPEKIEALKPLAPLNERLSEVHAMNLPAKPSVFGEIEKPKNWYEEGLQNTVASLGPTAALSYLMGGPAAILPGLAGTTATSFVEPGAKALGAPNYVSMPLGIGAGVVAGLATTAAQNKLPFLPSTAKKVAQEELGPLSRQAGSMAADPLKKPVNDLGNVYRALGEGKAKELIKEIHQTVTQNVSNKGNVDLNKLLFMREHIDDLWPQIKKHGLEKYVMPIRNEINDIMRSDAAKIINPKWWNALATNDQLTIAEHMQNSVSKFADRLKPGLLDFIAGKKWGVSKAVVYGLLKGVGGAQALATYLSKPAFRKIYFDLAKSLTEEEFLSNADKLMKYVK